MRQLLAAATAGLLLSGALHIYPIGAAVPAEVVTLNPSVRHQTMRGWGGTLSFLRNLNDISQPTIDQIVDEAVDDLGLTFLRIGYAMLQEPFNDNANPRSINLAAFNDADVIDREVAQSTRRFNQRVQANGEPPTYLLDKDWESSAPAWMNDEEFAENITATVLYFRNRHGIHINFNSIDNEPTHFDPYTPERQRPMIKVMGRMFQENGLSTKVALNEGINASSTWDYIKAMENDADVWPHIGLLNWHLYGPNDPFRSLIRDFGAARGIPTAMTEFTQAQISHLIDDLTLGGVSYWTRYFVADRGPAVTASSNYFSVNLEGTSFDRNIAYNQFRQFMRYVRPGAVRIDASSTQPAIRAFGFDRSGSRVAVLVNTSAQAFDVTVQGLLPGRYGVSQTVGASYTEQGVQTADTSLGVRVEGNGILTVYPAPPNPPPIPTDWRVTPRFLTLPASAVTLSAAAQDIEREALTFAWSVKSQPATASTTIASPASPQTNATGLSVAGTYVFTVTIRDATGNSVTRDVSIRAYQGNQAPIIVEGNRYYKKEWILLPRTTVTYGVLFISAFDLEGDPVTTSFSVVSQPAGASASFNGSTVSGLTVAGNYTFRFTASDPTHTVSRDFVRTVVGSSPPPTESGPTPTPGTGSRRRPPDTDPVGRAVPRQGGDRPAQASMNTSGVTGSRSRGTTSTVSDLWRSLRVAPDTIDQLVMHLATIDDISPPAEPWHVIDVLDHDGDGQVDTVVIELVGGGLWVVTLVRGAD
jgi:O-glycosyl hydrolase